METGCEGTDQVTLPICLAKPLKIIAIKNIEGPTKIRTRIPGFKVQCANHYTMRPAY